MKDYVGKVNTGGAKDVKAPFPQKSQSKPEVQKGKDLRSRSGVKRSGVNEK